jgi:DNA-binding NtrC family response regulator
MAVHQENDQVTSIDDGFSGVELAGDRSVRPSRGTIVVAGKFPTETGTLAQALESLATTTVVSGPDALAQLAKLDADVIVAGETVDQQPGAQFLRQAASIRPAAVRILLGGRGMPVASDDSGLATVLSKPVDMQALGAVCAVALRCAVAQAAVRELRSENDRLRQLDTKPTVADLDELNQVEHYENLLTRSPAMQRGIEMLRKIEDAETPVLIYGETGTGKELVAGAVHARSRRCAGPFRVAKLSAVPESRHEIELFGHVRGAFAGAVPPHDGVFAEAEGGSVFLDEVTKASPSLQVALLRVLEEGLIVPVGADQPRRVNVRIIAGTNRNLPELVRTGLFRQDLYYRLSVFPVDIPPLRERVEDIFPLANHFLASASLALAKKPPAISREARAILEAHRWEGNVRELRTVMERAAILCSGSLLIAADLPVPLANDRADAGTAHAAASITIPPTGATLQHLEREIFLKTLELTNGNQSRAARILGLRESTLRFRLRKLGIASRRDRRKRSQSVASARPVRAL